MSSPTRILGTLSTADGNGVVRMEDTIAAGIDDVWSALTDPARLVNWLGEIDGDLRVGGEYRAHYFASDWKGTGRIVECEPPNHARMDVTDGSSSGGGAFELWLNADGDGTHVVWEERGMPVHLLAAYGAGIQIHVEDLASYLAGREIDHRRAGARWEELAPAYEELATRVESA